MKTTEPQTLIEAIQFFSDPDVCREFVANLRWPNGVICPRCGAENPYFLQSRKVWKCRNKECHKQFSVKVGTIFEDSALGLDKWLAAMWMLVNAKNGASSHEIGRALGVRQATAWHMGHRIREAMQTGSIEKLGGEVEADETYVGGKLGNTWGKRRAKKPLGTGGVGKAIVMGLLERHGEVRTCVIPNTKRATLHAEVLANVKSGSTVYTDFLASYRGLDVTYIHQMIDHAEAYVEGEVHTNGLENYWSLFKRCVKGTYVSVDPAHLYRYLDEENFRFNNRGTNDRRRFLSAVQGTVGKRLTYKELIGSEAPAGSDGNAADDGTSPSRWLS
ncbi:MAG TPA: IS1595 family transposase [Armatimonadota bacterium]|jgi:transposase-like protein